MFVLLQEEKSDAENKPSGLVEAQMSYDEVVLISLINSCLWLLDDFAWVMECTNKSDICSVTVPEQ